MKDLLLAIDNGTQSLKALVFDADGRLLARQAVAFAQPYVSRQPGWAEQDPEVYWQALCRGCRSLWESDAVDRGRLAGLALTCQRGTVINVDAQGRPLRPAIVWLDQRKTLGQPFLGGWWGLVFRLARLTGTIAYFQAEAETNWIRTYQPEVWKNTYKYLLLSGYLTFRLTGTFVDSVGCQVGYLPFDFKKKRWAASWSWKWPCLNIDPALLPDLVAPGRLLGEVSAAAAKATGLPPGLPVIAAAADKACEVIGSGSLEPSIGCLSYGTTATINVTHPRYIEAIALIPPYPSAVPDRYSMEVQVFRGFWMVNWFKHQFGHPERQKAAINGVGVEKFFDQLVDDAPPGAMGLVLQPFWSPGLKMPGPEAKGAIIGFGDVHTRAHLYRAILEGMAYALREGKERIEKATRIPLTSLRVSGGGSQSEKAMQITADVFGLPTARPQLYETSGLGAAIDVAVGCGLHTNFADAVKAMTRIGDVFEPDPHTHQLYDALYNRVYRRMYDRLKPLYEEIRAITGYPG